MSLMTCVRSGSNNSLGSLPFVAPAGRLRIHPARKIRSTVLITAPHLIDRQAVLLASRGCVREANTLIATGLAGGMIDSGAAAALGRQISAYPAGQLPPDHRVFGILQDSIVGSLHVTPVTRRDHAREAFRQGVRWIEIETSSQCNRRCAYCPNSRADRITSNDFLDADVFNRLVSDLAEIDYDGSLNFVGNNEFFMHRDNRGYVEAAHRAVPRAPIKLYSNGDYMRADDLHWAAGNGVRLIHVTLHAGPTKSYDDTDALRRVLLFQKQLGMAMQLQDFSKGQRLQFTARYGALTLFVKAQDMTQLGHDWNGLVTGGGRTARVATDPCSYPIRQFIVSHDGDVLMCCMAFKERTQINSNTGATVSNLADHDSIFQAYTSAGMTAWRLAAFNAKAKSGPCGTCPGFDPREAEAAPLARYMTEQSEAMVAA
jgi:Iron-sulfur cluster-binding domain